MKSNQQVFENFQLDSQLDINALAESYQIDQRFQVQGVLPTLQIRRLSQGLEEQVEYKNAFSLNNRVAEVSMAQWQSFADQERRSLMTNIMSQAAEGHGFWYGRCDISGRNTGVLQQVFEWLNSENMLKAVRKITGIDDLQSASGQASRFLPGEFLTRHRDVVEGESRKVAYVINCTHNWHPDWGGLLQFFEQSGKPRDAWTPSYNSLSLFHVQHIHSVTCVAPFAPRPRFAVSGWFSTAR